MFHNRVAHLFESQPGSMSLPAFESGKGFVLCPGCIMPMIPQGMLALVQDAYVMAMERHKPMERIVGSGSQVRFSLN